MSKIFGVAYSTPYAVAARVSSVIGRGRVGVVRSTGLVARRRVFVVVGVDNLVALRSQLETTTAAVVVIDTLRKLEGIERIVMLDASPGESWGPRQPNYAPLWKYLRSKSVAPKIVVKPVDVLTNFISDVRSKGILDKVLTLYHKLPPKDRDRLTSEFVKFVHGRCSVANLSRKFAPKRQGTSISQAHGDLIKALQSPYTRKFCRAIKQAHPAYDKTRVNVIADKLGIDAFEINYFATISRRDRKTKKDRS